MGPFFSDPREYFLEDELAGRKVWWPEHQYVQTGDAPRGLSSGWGVGGGTNVWTGAAFRLFERDFRVLTEDGEQPGASLADWPLTYTDLAPYYDAVEAHIQLAGEPTPWDRSGQPPPPQPAHGYYHHTTVLREGFQRLGFRTAPGPMAIASRPTKRREACCGCGYCVLGCKTGAMYNTAIAEIPPALATGRLDLRDQCVARAISTSMDGTRAEAVEYVDSSGNSHRQPARAIVAACHTIEIPRLMLASANRQHPRGLANSSDQLGRNSMSHISAHVLGIFPQAMRPWEGFTLNHLCCLDCGERVPGRPFVGGFAMETYTSLPASLAVSSVGGAWGAELKSIMRQYPNMAGLFTIGEGLPASSNRVTIDPEEQDAFGLPRAHLHYDWHPNDLRLQRVAQDTGEAVLLAAGAVRALRQPTVQVHPLGTARMGTDPATSVANADGRTHDVPNLYLAGGALFPTGSSVNPTLTILALAWKTAVAIADTFGYGVPSPAELRARDEEDV